MSDQSVGLVIDEHYWEGTVVDTGVPQGSPVSPTLFVIYLSRVFKRGREKGTRMYGDVVYG